MKLSRKKKKEDYQSPLQLFVLLQNMSLAILKIYNHMCVLCTYIAPWITAAPPTLSVTDFVIHPLLCTSGEGFQLLTTPGVEINNSQAKWLGCGNAFYLLKGRVAYFHWEDYPAVLAPPLPILDCFSSLQFRPHLPLFDFLHSASIGDKKKIIRARSVDQ